MLGLIEKTSIVILICLYIAPSYQYNCNHDVGCIDCSPTGEFCYDCESGYYRIDATWCEKAGNPCFPGSSMVTTATGNIAMEKLNIGDSVLTVLANEEMGFTKVVGFADRRPDKEGSFLSITAVNQAAHSQTVKLTTTHNIYVKTTFANDKEEYTPRFAEDVLIGNVFKTQTDNGTTEATVTHVTLHKETGVYNPLTETGTMLVDGTLVSCYGSFNHYLAHLATAPIRWFPWLFTDAEKPIAGTLPFVQTLKYIARSYVAPIVSLN